MNNTIILKKGRDKSMRLRHHWIFSGGIRKVSCPDGEITAICADNGDVLGYGYYNSKSQIAVRVLSFENRYPDDAFIRERITDAFESRKRSPLLGSTDSYRIIFSEGDLLPGLIVDSYAGHLSVQFLTLGMDRMKEQIVSALTDIIKPVSIYEKSDHDGRKIEGLPPCEMQLFGSTPDEIYIEESGVKIAVDILRGQKTGFFLDQRENRALVMDLAKEKRVLNLFSYNGGFSLTAIRGGAVYAKSVDISGDALLSADRSAAANGFGNRHQSVKQDVFEYIRKEDIAEDLIIIDPPAFVKNRHSVDQGCRGYKDVNLQVFRKAVKGALVLTCSCSRFVDIDLFQKIVFGAAVDANRTIRIIRRTGHPADHPINICHPETEYLKALLVEIG